MMGSNTTFIVLELEIDCVILGVWKQTQNTGRERGGVGEEASRIGSRRRMFKA